MNSTDNGFLAMTQISLRCTDFKDEFYPSDNQSMDAPEFIPSGSTWACDTGANVVVIRDGYSFN